MQMPSALVTGASSGIGLEISRVLAPMVDRLVVTGRQVEALRDLEQELGDIVEVEVIVADLSTESGVDSLIVELEMLTSWSTMLDTGCMVGWLIRTQMECWGSST